MRSYWTDLVKYSYNLHFRIMIQRLKREKKLTNKALRVLLAPTVTRLDLEGVYLTNNTLRMVWTQCPHLQAVSLKDCGYIITDNVLANFTRVSKSGCMYENIKCINYNYIE